MPKDEKYDATFVCNAVRGKKGGGFAFGEVQIDHSTAGWHGAFCPARLTGAYAVEVGRSYRASVKRNGKDPYGNSPWFVVEIVRLVTEVFDAEDTASLLAELAELEIGTATELAHAVPGARPVDVYVTMQDMWRTGEVARVALHREPGRAPDGVLWAVKGYNLRQLLD